MKKTEVIYWRNQEAWEKLRETLDSLKEHDDAITARLANEALDALDEHYKAAIAFESAARSVTLIWTRRPIESAQLGHLQQIAALDTARVRYERSIDIVESIAQRYNADPIYEILPLGSRSSTPVAIFDDDAAIF